MAKETTTVELTQIDPDLLSARVGELLPHWHQVLGPYSVLRLGDALHYYHARYLKTLLGLVDGGEVTLLDGGAGFGWLSLAFALHTRGHLCVALDVQVARLQVLRELANLLGVSGRVFAVVASLEDLPFRDGAFRLVASIEVLEHIGEDEPRKVARDRQSRALSELARSCSGWVLVATPNRWFPWVPHDVSLPFAHWLPYRIRLFYATLFRRRSRLARVHLLSPREVQKGLRNVRPVTKFLNFNSPEDWLSIFPLRTPYLPRPGSVVDPRKRKLMTAYVKLVHRLFGATSRLFMHTICTVYAVEGGRSAGTAAAERTGEKTTVGERSVLKGGNGPKADRELKV